MILGLYPLEERSEHWCAFSRALHCFVFGVKALEECSVLWLESSRIWLWSTGYMFGMNVLNIFVCFLDYFTVLWCKCSRRVFCPLVSIFQDNVMVLGYILQGDSDCGRVLLVWAFFCLVNIFSNAVVLLRLYLLDECSEYWCVFTRVPHWSLG